MAVESIQLHRRKYIPGDYTSPDVIALLLDEKQGPFTMIVPASGHQVRCISWVQMVTFNKEIGFYVD